MDGPNQFLSIYYTKDGKFYNGFVRRTDKTDHLPILYFFDGFNEKGKPIIYIEQTYTEDGNKRTDPNTEKEHVVLEDAIINWREKQQSEVRSSFINRSENLYIQFGANMKYVTKGTFFKLINDDYLQMTKMYNKTVN